MLDWSDFRIFLAIARAGTLSGAARQLGLDQSTLSRRLAALEASAGSRLFERTPRGYDLSPAGHGVLKNAEEIEAQAIAAERRLAGHDARLEGHVKLAASDGFASWFVIPQLQRFAQLNPGISVGLVAGNRAVSLARREADVALRMSKPSEPNLVARRLGVAAWALYGGIEYLERHGSPRLRDKLSGHDVVGFERELSTTVGARFLTRHGARARVLLTTNSLVTQAAAVAANIGLSPLPCLFGDPHVGLARALPANIGQHEIWLVVHPDVKQSARVRALLDHLTRVVTAQAPLLSGKLNARRQRRRA